MSKRQNQIIKNLKSEFNNIYSRIEANFSAKHTIHHLKIIINENLEKVKLNENQLKEIQHKVNNIESTISPYLINRKKLKNKNEELAGAVPILAKKIDDIKLKDPNMQQRAMNEIKKYRNNLLESIELLANMAPDMKSEILKAKDFAYMFQEREIENELKKVGPLKLQNPA